MKRLIYIFLVALIGLSSCSKDEDALTPSEGELFPSRELTELDHKLIELYSGYNTRIEYLFLENLLPDDWYFITPPKEEVVYPISKMLFEAWLTPLVNGSNQAFVQKTFPKQLILVGSEAKQQNGTVVLGQAEGGTLIRFTEANKYTPSNVEWIRKQLHVAYHEYCHILHQTFILPDEYREVTPDNYTRSGWMTVQLSQAIEKGMVTPYGTSNVSEDFVELFSCYITYKQADWDYLFNDEKLPTDLSTITPKEIVEMIKRNEGRKLIRTKYQILEKFMTTNGVNMESIRTEVQEYLKTAAALAPAPVPAP